MAGKMGILLDLNEEETEGVLVIRLNGRLDSITSSLLETQVIKHLENNIKKIILNFNGINYISSAGIRILLSLTLKADSASCLMMLCSIQPNVFDIIKLTGLLSGLHIAVDEAEAIKNIK